jgi:hypothetical protein
MPTFTLNFSRPGNQVVGQYYNFLRLGRAGYTQVMECLSQTARWLGDGLRESQHFEVVSDGSAIPVVSYRLAGDFGYTEFDVSESLRAHGWQVPAYTMPEGATDVTMLRIVVRGGLFDGPGQGPSRRHHHCVGPPRRAQAPRPLQRGAALRALAPRTGLGQSAMVT